MKIKLSMGTAGSEDGLASWLLVAAWDVHSHFRFLVGCGDFSLVRLFKYLFYVNNNIAHANLMASRSSQIMIAPTKYGQLFDNMVVTIVSALGLLL